MRCVTASLIMKISSASCPRNSHCFVEFHSDCASVVRIAKNAWQAWLWRAAKKSRKRRVSGYTRVAPRAKNVTIVMASHALQINQLLGECIIFKVAEFLTPHVRRRRRGDLELDVIYVKLRDILSNGYGFHGDFV